MNLRRRCLSLPGLWGPLGLGARGGRPACPPSGPGLSGRHLARHLFYRIIHFSGNTYTSTHGDELMMWLGCEKEDLEWRSCGHSGLLCSCSLSCIPLGPSPGRYILIGVVKASPRAVAETELKVCVVILNLWCQMHVFLIFFDMIFTSRQRIWQKSVWSYDYTGLHVAPPLPIAGSRDGERCNPVWLLLCLAWLTSGSVGLAHLGDTGGLSPPVPQAPCTAAEPRH
jgi:hypothetical protein